MRHRIFIYVPLHRHVMLLCDVIRSSFESSSPKHVNEGGRSLGWVNAVVTDEHPPLISQVHQANFTCRHLQFISWFECHAHSLKTYIYNVRDPNYDALWLHLGIASLKSIAGTILKRHGVTCGADRSAKRTNRRSRPEIWNAAGDSRPWCHYGIL